VFECRLEPNLVRANSILKDAVKMLPPDGRLLERAEIHELHGRVREKAGYINATLSYTEAERLYQRIVDGRDSDDVLPAQEGLKRVREALQRIRLQPLTQTDESVLGAPPNGRTGDN
jgi:hypothetical protein